MENYKKLERGEKYITPLAEFKPELQPNGRIVECIEDKGCGFLVVKINNSNEPNIWLLNEKNIKILEK